MEPTLRYSSNGHLVLVQDNNGWHFPTREERLSLPSGAPLTEDDIDKLFYPQED